VRDFNAELKRRACGLLWRATGTVRNQFGDGRVVTTLSLFIPRTARPNLTANLDQAVNSLVRTEVEIAARMGPTGPGGVGGPGGRTLAFCSGCKEGKEKAEKEKEGSQEKGPKGEKDGKELELAVTQPIGKVELELAGAEAAALLGFYDKIGVRRFKAGAVGGGAFTPLV
jgi:hypothetical protein